MSKIVAFGSATVETGKNKGQPSLLTFATGISPENANGLPVSGGKVYVEVVKDVPTVIEFESADEVRSIAGDNFDAFILDAANAHMKTLVRNAITADARKLTLPPSNIADWVSSVCTRITAETAFAPVVREKGTKAPRGVKAEVAGLAAKASQMSQDELLAAIAALAAKLG